MQPPAHGVPRGDAPPVAPYLVTEAFCAAACLEAARCSAPEPPHAVPNGSVLAHGANEHSSHAPSAAPWSDVPCSQDQAGLRNARVIYPRGAAPRIACEGAAHRPMVRHVRTRIGWQDMCRCGVRRRIRRSSSGVPSREQVLRVAAVALSRSPSPPKQVNASAAGTSPSTVGAASDDPRRAMRYGILDCCDA